jgi:hypothetical protein
MQRCKSKKAYCTPGSARAVASSKSLKLSIPELSDFDPKSEDYVENIETAYKVCMGELTYFLDVQKATLDRAQRRLEELAVSLSAELGVSIAAPDCIKFDSDSQKSSFDVKVRIFGADECIVKHIHKTVEDMLMPYVSRLDDLESDSAPLIARTNDFYEALVRLTKVKRVSSSCMPGVYTRMARVFIIREGLLSEFFIDAKDGTVYDSDNLFSDSGEADIIKDWGFDSQDMYGVSFQRGFDVYIAENVSEFVRDKDLIFQAFSLIERGYARHDPLRCLRNSKVYDEDFDIKSAIEISRQLSAAFKRPSMLPEGVEDEEVYTWPDYPN